MLDSFKKLFKKKNEKDIEETKENNSKSKVAAKERLHLVLMQDRANVSVDFLDMMKQEIVDVIKKYIDIDENEMEVKLTNQINQDGTNGAPALYANIPVISIKNEYTVKKVAGMKIADVNNLKKQNDEKLLAKKGEEVNESIEDNEKLEDSPKSKKKQEKSKNVNKKEKDTEKSKVDKQKEITETESSNITKNEDEITANEDIIDNKQENTQSSSTKKSTTRKTSSDKTTANKKNKKVTKSAEDKKVASKK